METLDWVNSIEDMRLLDFEQLDKLCEELRAFIIDKVSKTGGHLASNLGVVELTLALHKVFNTPEDKIVWDVGHQTYVHKILTGRKDAFDNLRKMGGISGFPKTKESQHDCFNTGHSSTSISVALGMAKARDLLGQKNHVTAIIGDGAMTGGMAFEALNDAGQSHSNLIVILNDNEMSIAQNVGGLSKYLSKIRTEPFYYKVKEDFQMIIEKIPAVGKAAKKVLHKVKGSLKFLLMSGMLFEELGFHYYGPIDGHNIKEMTDVLEKAKIIKGPVFIHICTKKGKGYKPAELEPHKFHGVSAFEIETGAKKKKGVKTYSDVFGDTMVELAEEEPLLVGVSAAMSDGTGLSSFKNKYPKRLFDVGIAEQHAVTFAAGLASQGIKPVVAIYSSFFQRAYDQILHDVALQNLSVIFAADRAGIVGEDGETHQGLYDISFISSIPNMTIIAPSDFYEMEQMLKYSVNKHNGPIFIRYPRGKGEMDITQKYTNILNGHVSVGHAPIEYGKAEKLVDGDRLSLIAFGNMVETAIEAASILLDRGINCDIINARFAKPLDEKLILDSAKKTGIVVTLEDNTKVGGFGSNVIQMLNQHGVTARTKILAYPDEIITHGSPEQLRQKYGLDKDSIAKKLADLLSESKADGELIK